MADNSNISKPEEKNSHDDLKCGLCVKGYRDPRHLNCLHSFCLECLQEHVNKNKWKKVLLCPLCKKEMIIPKEGLATIPKDFYIRAKQEVDKLKNAKDCDTCKENPTVTNRCLDCDLNLCGDCKVKHASPDSEQIHHFLEVIEQKTNQRDKPSSIVTKITQRNACSKHVENEVSIYCTKCKIAICLECKEDKHKSHSTENLADVAKHLRGSLTHFLRAIKEFLPDFEDFAKKVRSSQKELDKDLENAVKDIQSRSRFLQREIEKISQNLINEVKEKHKAESEVLDKEVKEVINSYKSMSNVASSAERILKVGTDLNVIDSFKRIQKKFMQAEDELPKLSKDKIETVGFVPGGLKAQSLPVMFGQCTKGDISLPTLPIPWGIRVAKDYEMTPVGAFRIRNSHETVQAIAPVSETEAWVSCGWGTKEVHLVTIDGHKKKTVTLDIQVDHICTTPSGEALVSSYEDKYIRKISKDFVVGDFAMPHLFPGGMVMTKRKELFVCAVDSYTTRRSEHSDRCILKMSEYGMILDQIDEYGETILFGAPYRVTESPNRDLCVTDREEGKLRVTVIDQEGAIRFIYKGPPDVKLDQPFNPLGVCCDRLRNLLVADWGNHRVHLINSEGEFQGFILSKKDGLCKPNAMALDKSGNLWIGDGTATIRVYKYGKRDY